MHPGYARGDVDFPGASFDAWLTTEPADDYEPFCGKCWDTGCSLCTDPEELAKNSKLERGEVKL